MQLSLLTYNVHSCLTAPAGSGVELIARIVRSCSPDIVALQELDAGCTRSNNIHQAEQLGRMTGMEAIFEPLLKINDGEYGIGFLLKKNISIASKQLYTLQQNDNETRPGGVLSLELHSGENKIHFYNVSLSPRQKERQRQVPVVRELIRGEIDADENVILMGDFNAMRGSATIRTFSKMLKACRPGLLSPGTFPAKYPLLQLDHIFCSKEIRILSSRTITTTLCREASDHLPLQSKIEIID